jgi:hypothetical protein
LKKPSVAFSTSSTEKRGFQLTAIFNGLIAIDNVGTSLCRTQPVEKTLFSTGC